MEDEFQVLTTGKSQRNRGRMARSRGKAWTKSYRK